MSPIDGRTLKKIGIVITLPHSKCSDAQKEKGTEATLCDYGSAEIGLFLKKRVEEILVQKLRKSENCSTVFSAINATTTTTTTTKNENNNANNTGKEHGTSKDSDPSVVDVVGKVKLIEADKTRKTHDLNKRETFEKCTDSSFVAELDAVFMYVKKKKKNSAADPPLLDTVIDVHSYSQNCFRSDFEGTELVTPIATPNVVSNNGDICHLCDKKKSQKNDNPLVDSMGTTSPSQESIPTKRLTAKKSH